MTLSRRQFLTRIATAAAASVSAWPVLAQSSAQFGLIRNSSADQTRAFQEMLDWSARRQRPIYLEAGTYRLSTIYLPEGVQLIGMPDQTVLEATTSNPLVRADDLARIELRDIILDGSLQRPTNDGSALVSLRNVAQATLQNIEIAKAGGHGFYLEGCSGMVLGCTIKDSGQFGLFGRDCKNLMIADNTVSHCGDGGIILYQSDRGHDGAQILRNQISNIRADSGGTGQNGNGINVFRADNVLIQDNKIADCKFSAIRANATTNTRMLGNTCLRSGETAVYAEFEYRDVTIQNNLVDGGGNGISVPNLDVGGRGALITGNIVRNIVGPGPYERPDMHEDFGNAISVEADAIVRDNFVDGARRVGINAGWGPYLDNVKITGNQIFNAEIGIGATSVEGAGQVTITDNTISARNGAIRSHRWTELDGPDLGISPERAPANIIVSQNTVI